MPSKATHQQKAQESVKEEAPPEKEAKGDPAKGSEPPERNIYMEFWLSLEAQIRMCCPSIVLAMGAPGMGKTQFGKFLFYQMAHVFQHGLIICPNPSARLEWDILQKPFVVDFYHRDIIEALMLDQEANGFPPCFLVLDDCLGEAEFRDPIIAKLCTQFRKYNIYVWFGLQYLGHVLPPVVRQCLQFVYVFRTLEQRSTKMLWESFFSMFFKNAVALMIALMLLPTKHHCLYLDVKELKLNVVHCPKDLPEFVLRWETAPKKEDEDKASSDEEGYSDDDMGAEAVNHSLEPKQKPKKKTAKDVIHPELKNIDKKKKTKKAKATKRSTESKPSSRPVRKTRINPLSTVTRSKKEHAETFDKERVVVTAPSFLRL